MRAELWEAAHVILVVLFRKWWLDWSSQKVKNYHPERELNPKTLRRSRILTRNRSDFCNCRNITAEVGSNKKTMMPHFLFLDLDKIAPFENTKPPHQLSSSSFCYSTGGLEKIRSPSTVSHLSREKLSSRRLDRRKPRRRALSEASHDQLWGDATAHAWPWAAGAYLC